MRDGFAGSWFYTNPFTTEPVRPIFLFVFYLGLGHVARVAGLSLVLAYHLARVASGVFLMFSVDRMIRALGWRGGTRVLAFAFVFLGGGVGWLLRWTGLQPVPVEFMQTEGFCFQSMASYPHFVLAIAFMVWILTDAYRHASGSAGRSALLSSASAAFALAWVHPRPLLTLLVVCAIAAAWCAARGYAPLRRWAAFILVILAAAAGPMVVSMLTVRADPLWVQWSRTETLSSAPWQYLLAYGLLWPLALAGAARAVRQRVDWAPLLIGWLIAGSLLPYLPIASQGRLIIGWNVPLALLAGYAVGAGLLPRLAAAPPTLARFRPLLVTALCLLLSLSCLAYLGVGVDRVLKGAFPGYFSADRAEAMEWLGVNTDPQDVVLSSVLSGMFIPPYAGNRVVQGHWAETFDAERKKREVEEIFSSSTGPDRREALLEAFGVRYLIFGQWERELGPYDPAEDPAHWKPRWVGAATAIFERIPEPGA